MFTNTWKTTHNNHEIVVTNSWFGSSNLYIDGLLKDTKSGLFSVTLNAEDFLVVLQSNVFSLKCEIFSSGKKIFPEN